MRPLKVILVTPAAPGSPTGNRVTASRWAAMLRSLGHRVAVRTEYAGERADVLVALHARHSHASVVRFRRQFPQGAMVVGLAGTDYTPQSLRRPETVESLRLADRLVALQPLALRALPRAYRRKARVILQSAVAPHPARPTRGFDLCVLAHLRAVKDPLRAAEASRLLPASSRIRIIHLGAALDAGLARRARAEERRNPRYRWLGQRPRIGALRRLARCRALVLSSVSEGGANVVSEAIAASVPVLASRIPGSVGLLGAGYAGYFPVGDTRALARLLERFERDARFRERLRAWVRRLSSHFTPAKERRAWARLLAELPRESR